MGDTIIKANPDEDFYVVYSSIVNAPTYWGSRAELEREYPHCAPRRFEDADRTGTSSRWSGYREFAWDDSNLTICEGITMPEGAVWGTLKRKDLRKFCELTEAEDNPEQLLEWQMAADLDE